LGGLGGAGPTGLVGHMPGYVGQNDTDFTLLQEEFNAPISRPLQPNFALGPSFLSNFGAHKP